MSKQFNTSDGIITGRNGTVDIRAIEVFKIDGLIRIDGVSKKTGTTINGGLSFDLSAERELRDWLSAHLPA